MLESDRCRGRGVVIGQFVTTQTNNLSTGVFFFVQVPSYRYALYFTKESACLRREEYNRRAVCSFKGGELIPS